MPESPHLFFQLHLNRDEASTPMKNQNGKGELYLSAQTVPERMLSAKPPKTCVEHSSTVIKHKESQLNMGMVEKASR